MEIVRKQGRRSNASRSPTSQRRAWVHRWARSTNSRTVARLGPGTVRAIRKCALRMLRRHRQPRGATRHRQARALVRGRAARRVHAVGSRPPAAVGSPRHPLHLAQQLSVRRRRGAGRIRRRRAHQPAPSPTSSVTLSKEATRACASRLRTTPAIPVLTAEFGRRAAVSGRHASRRDRGSIRCPPLRPRRHERRHHRGGRRRGPDRVGLVGPIRRVRPLCAIIRRGDGRRTRDSRHARAPVDRNVVAEARRHRGDGRLVPSAPVGRARVSPADADRGSQQRGPRLASARQGPRARVTRLARTDQAFSCPRMSSSRAAAARRGSRLPTMA